MKKFFICYFLISFVLFSGTAQEKNIKQYSNLTEQDSSFFYRLPQKKLNLSEWGKQFLGIPYVAATLEKGSDIDMVLNLTELDCTTFVENTLALSLLDSIFPLYFEQKLREIRYRKGKAEGYLSRLHYFSEWISDNEAKGFVEDITKKLGGIRVQKQLNFMSTHIKSYPVLVAQPHLVDSLKGIEQRLSNSARYILPKNQIKAKEEHIKDGDIIAIATNIEGLDFVHVGIAVRDADTHRVYLLHASSLLKKVVITTVPLVDFLAKNKKYAGIAILRVNDR